MPLFIVHIEVQVRTKDRAKAEELVDEWMSEINTRKIK
jgi:hypothetical protein